MPSATPTANIPEAELRAACAELALELHTSLVALAANRPAQVAEILCIHSPEHPSDPSELGALRLQLTFQLAAANTALGGLRSTKALRGLVRAPAAPVSLDAMDTAVAAAACAQSGMRALDPLRYSVVQEADGVFVAQWLDGEIASDGATEADAIANLREAVALYRTPLADSLMQIPNAGEDADFTRD